MGKKNRGKSAPMIPPKSSAKEKQKSSKKEGTKSSVDVHSGAQATTVTTFSEGTAVVATSIETIESVRALSSEEEKDADEKQKLADRGICGGNPTETARPKKAVQDGVLAKFKAEYVELIHQIRKHHTDHCKERRAHLRTCFQNSVVRISREAKLRALHIWRERLLLLSRGNKEAASETIKVSVSSFDRSTVAMEDAISLLLQGDCGTARRLALRLVQRVRQECMSRTTSALVHRWSLNASEVCLEEDIEDLHVEIAAKDELISDLQRHLCRTTARLEAALADGYHEGGWRQALAEEKAQLVTSTRRVFGETEKDTLDSTVRLLEEELASAQGEVTELRQEAAEWKERALKKDLRTAQGRGLSTGHFDASGASVSSNGSDASTSRSPPHIEQDKPWLQMRGAAGLKRNNIKARDNIKASEG